MGSNGHKDILIAPLDWGLGHTTRCVPIIRQLLSGGHLVTFAGNEWQRSYITKTFGGIETIHLEGYNVTYGKRGSGFLFSMVYQMPRLAGTIRMEHEWLNNLTQQRQFDGIISDNRYGLFHNTIPSVMMTHQLQVQSGMGDAVDHLLRRMHYKYIQRFRSCWVVDVPGKPNLSGKLAHPQALPNNAQYVGLLSQMADAVRASPTEAHLLILLSGPEPQRTILSEMLWVQVQGYPGKVVFVEGSDKGKSSGTVPENISYYGQLTREELQPLIEGAKMVVCRSGYSTLMDLMALGKKAILVPTPGQTEQEYLGRHLHEEGVFYSAAQKELNLVKALEDAEGFPWNPILMENAHQQYRNVLDAWIQSL